MNAEHANRLGRLLVGLERFDLTRDLDLDYQAECADVAQYVDDVELWARLQRNALTCHHCPTVPAPT